jgi:hypothetical protein
MIGRCAACGAFGEVGLLAVPNGAQRQLCPTCSNGWGPPQLPDRDRFRLLVQRVRDGSIAPAEERDLRFALDGILERSSGRSESARVLLRELLARSMMNPNRPRRPRP